MKLITGYGVLCGISYQSLGWSLIYDEGDI